MKEKNQFALMCELVDAIGPLLRSRAPSALYGESGLIIQPYSSGSLLPQLNLRLWLIPMTESLLILPQKECRAIALERKSVLLWKEISENL